MNRSLALSLAMLPYLPADAPHRLEQTRARILDLIDQSAATHAGLVAFPEMATTDESSNLWQVEPLDGPTLSAISEKARQRRIHVVCPLLTLEDGKRYNSSVLIGRDGSRLGVYHKMFPTHWEMDQGITPGEEAGVFETDFGRVGLSICFDIQFWEAGSGFGANQAEVVIWSSTWDGARQLTRWPLEFGFFMGAVCTHHATAVDPAGRMIATQARSSLSRVGRAPLLNATLDLDVRVVHHDINIDRLVPLFRKYGPTALTMEHLNTECLLVLTSDLPDRSTDDLIAEFGLETMRDFLSRVRRDRLLALEGKYVPDLEKNPPLPGTPR